MSESTPQLTDVSVHASDSRIRGVKAAHVESRPWIEDFPTSPALSHYQLIHVGIMETTAPTRIVRTRQTTTYFLACFGGKGKVLIDGRWRIARRVAPDRVISTVDTEARHTRKSKSARRDGFRGHLAAEPRPG